MANGNGSGYGGIGRNGNANGAPRVPEFKLKEQMCDIGRRIWLKGFCAGNEGNHSYRLAEDRVQYLPVDHLIDVGVGPAVGGVERPDVDQFLEALLRPSAVVHVSVEEDQCWRQIEVHIRGRCLELLQHLRVELIPGDHDGLDVISVDRA